MKPSPLNITLFVIILTVWPLAGSLAAKDIFVSPRGSDTNPGTKAKPLATISAARDLARRHRENPSSPVKILFLEGDYAIRQTVLFTDKDSGTTAAPVVYQAEPGKKVRFLGGMQVTGFKPVKDASILSRLNAEAGRRVMVADLRALGLTDFGKLRSRGFSRGEVPAHMELFFDGQPMTLARWPNQGEWAHIHGAPEETAQPDGHGGKIGKLENGFFYESDRIRSWKNPHDVWVHGYWAWDWANSYEQIASVDLDRRWLKLLPPYGHYGYRKGQRIYFLNVLEELDQPGEWFADAQSGLLYFWPPSTLSGKSCMVSILEEPMLRLQNVSHLHLDGIEFLAARGSAIAMDGGMANRIRNCRFRNLGTTAITVSNGKEHGIEYCDIENTGDGGVILDGGDRLTLEPAGHFVENCRFQKQGRWSKCYVPAIKMSGVGIRASHNHIQDHPHCAILYTGNDHLIEYNEILRVALETGDVGAIYSGRDYSFRGNVIRFNYIHHTGGVGMGSMGVYMDDCVSGTRIYGNLFYRVQRAVFLGGGRDFEILNNVFVDCLPAVNLDGRGMDPSPVWHNMVYNFMKQRLYSMPAELYQSRYPAMQALDELYRSDTGIPTGNIKVAHNISIGGQWLKIHWHAKPEDVRLENNFTDADPGFLDIAGQDFRIRKDSPVWSMGIEALPLEHIGIQKKTIDPRVKRK